MISREFPRVLVFDSGVGGLSVAARIRSQLRGVELAYLADNAAFPYGDQPESVVVERCCALIDQALQQFPCDVIVVACNTASTVVLPHLRAMTAVPVVGVVPAIKPASALTRNRRIGLLATPATIRRRYLDDLVNEFAGHCQVTRIGHPGLVRWVEESVGGVAVSQAELAQAVADFREAGVDTVVLGCTHYPLLLEALKAALPEVKFWVDSGDAIARRVAFLLEGVSRPDAEVGPEPVPVALFSGPAPLGLAEYMSRLDLRPRQILEAWPQPSGDATTAGSA